MSKHISKNNLKKVDGKSVNLQTFPRPRPRCSQLEAILPDLRHALFLGGRQRKFFVAKLGLFTMIHLPMDGLELPIIMDPQ